MRDSLPAVYILLHDTVLVDANCGQHVQAVLIAGLNAVEDQTDNNLLPRWASLIPELGSFQVNNIPNILHYSVQSTRRQDLVFVIVGYRNKQLGMPIIDSRPKIVSIAQSELVGVACRRRIWYSGSSTQLNHFPNF